MVHLYQEGGWLVLRAGTESVFLALLYPSFFSLFFLSKKSISRGDGIFVILFQKGVTPPAWDMWKGGRGGDQHTKGANKGLSRERSTFISSILISSQSVLPPPFSPPPFPPQFPAANSSEGWRRGEKKGEEGSPLSKKKIIPPPSTAISRRDKT